MIPFTAKEVIDAYAEYDRAVGASMAAEIAEELNEIAEKEGELFALECLLVWAANDAQEAEADGREAAEYEDWAYGSDEE